MRFRNPVLCRYFRKVIADLARSKRLSSHDVTTLHVMPPTPDTTVTDELVMKYPVVLGTDPIKDNNIEPHLSAPRAPRSSRSAGACRSSVLLICSKTSPAIGFDSDPIISSSICLSRSTWLSDRQKSGSVCAFHQYRTMKAAAETPMSPTAKLSTTTRSGNEISSTNPNPNDRIRKIRYGLKPLDRSVLINQSCAAFSQSSGFNGLTTTLPLNSRSQKSLTNDGTTLSIGFPASKSSLTAWHSLAIATVSWQPAHRAFPTNHAVFLSAV